MPASLSYPGVYIEEVSSGVRAITGVATSIAAFVGYTRKGTLNRATLVMSFADFERNFGGLDRESPLSYAIRQFFVNGGMQALVVRVAQGAQSAEWRLQDGSTPPQDVIHLTATSPGSWANDLQVYVYNASRDRSGLTDQDRIEQVPRNPDSEFNLVIKRLLGSTSATLEIHRNLNLNSLSPNYIVSVVNTASQLIRAERSVRPGLFNQQGFAVSASITFPISASDRIIAGTVDGNTSFELDLLEPFSDIDTLATAIRSAVDRSPVATRIEVLQSGADGDVSRTGCLKLASRASGESSSVAIAGGAYGSLVRAIGLGLANGGREITGDVQHRPAEQISGLPPVTIGNDGVKGGVIQLIGHEDEKSGIYALKDVDLFNLLSVPETFGLPELDANHIIQAAVGLCEQRRAFYIVDPPHNIDLNSPTPITGWAHNVSQSRNAAVYFPAIDISDPLDQFRASPMAPSGTLAGVYARTDSERGVWKAPAGTDASMKGVSGVSQPLNDIENGTLNLQGVNAIRNFPEYGTVSWGARTMKGSDAQADEYKYIPVRRTALFIEESLYRGLKWVVFEPNDEPLWGQIRLNVGAFMQNLFRQGAFAGKTPREAYLVKCDRETTTQNDVNLGIVNIIVGFAPLKPAEFVIVKIQQLAGQIQV
jgi:uncharacterized protein